MPDETTTNQENTPISQNTEVNMGSEPSNIPLEAPETPINAEIPVSLNNDNPENSPVSTPTLEEAKPDNLPAEGGKDEGISEPVQTSETRTAQIPGNEPLATEPETNTEPNVQEVKPEPVSVSTSGEAKPEPEKIIPVAVVVSNKNKIIELLAKAKNAIQFRKRKKLDKIMALFLKQSKITNDEVEKYLHVSDATAERYLNILEKENKIKQVGKTGKAVSYSRI